MKNRIFLFCLLAALAVSCVKEQQEVIQTITNEPEFYATIEGSNNPDTRVFVDDHLRVLWNADDRVSIFNRTTYNRQYRFTGADGANAGSFAKSPAMNSSRAIIWTMRIPSIHTMRIPVFPTTVR